MASPPSSSNNPAPSPLLPSLSLPKKRPPTGPPPINTSNTGTAGNDSMRHKRRKPSTASNISLTSHPLRQTSFPPEGVGAAASPVTSIGPGSAGVRWASRSPSVESTSVAGASISGVGQKRRRRGGGAARGGSSISGKKSSVTSAAPSVTGTTAGGDGADARSLVDGRPGSRGGSLIGGGAGAGAGDDVDDEDDEAGLVDTMMEGGGKMDEASVKQEREHLSMLIDAFDKDQTERYEIWRRVRLKKETVRRLANQTLSQSVPASVVTTINGYTKIFIGELIERARDVQTEWLAAAELARLEREQRQQHKNALPTTINSGPLITTNVNNNNNSTNNNNNSNNNDTDQSSANNPKTENPITTGTTVTTVTTISLPSSSSSSSPAPPPDPADTDMTDMTDVNVNATDPTTSTDVPPPSNNVIATGVDTAQQKPLTTAITTATATAVINPTEPKTHTNSHPDPETDPESLFQHNHNHDHDHDPEHPSINLHNHIQTLTQTLIRPPLTPDHLREALRRYKKDRQGGAAGFQGLSLQGRERVAVRMGGRRLFK